MPIHRKEYGSIVIEVPSKQLYISGGVVKTKPTLTKANTLTSVDKNKSIKLEPVKGNEVVVKSQGKIVDLKKEKKVVKERKDKAKKMTDKELEERIKKYLNI